MAWDLCVDRHVQIMWRTSPSPLRMLVSSPQTPGSASCFFISFFPLRLHMGKRFELDRELNHISAPWMSWLCAEAQTVGYQIRTQGLLFQSTFFFSHQHVSHSFLSFCLALILSLAQGSFPPSSSTTLSRLPVKTGGDPGCLVSGTSAAGCSDNRENFFYFIWVSHLCTSPIECEIGEVGRTEPARGFRHRWQGSYASPKNCVPVLLWLLVNFQPFHQRCYKNSILKALSVGEIESDAKK